MICYKKIMHGKDATKRAYIPKYVKTPMAQIALPEHNRRLRRFNVLADHIRFLRSRLESQCGRQAAYIKSSYSLARQDHRFKMGSKMFKAHDLFQCARSWMLQEQQGSNIQVYGRTLCITDSFGFLAYDLLQKDHAWEENYREVEICKKKTLAQIGLPKRNRRLRRFNVLAAHIQLLFLGSRLESQ